MMTKRCDDCVNYSKDEDFYDNTCCYFEMIDKECINFTDTIIDEIGGYHSEGIGFSPDGYFCGECNRITCVACTCFKKQI